MTRALAIVNPAAGGGTERADVEAVLSLLRERFETIDVAETALDHPTATELGERAVVERYDVAIAAGGDGTVGAVARALVGTEVTLGILPFGTFMNIARALEIPREDARAAAELIASAAMRRIDVGEVGGQVFFEAAGIGLDADAFNATRAVQRGQHGIALAALGAAQQVQREREFLCRRHVSAQGSTRKKTWVRRGSSYGQSDAPTTEAALRLSATRAISCGVMFDSVPPRLGAGSASRAA